MKTLVLGHGRNYEINNIRCSCYPLEKWFYTEYTCVDIEPLVNPDIVFDLRKNWSFCKENEYGLIIDTCGLGLYGSRRYGINTVNNIKRALNEGGVFYGWRQTRWQKINGELINFVEREN